MKRHPLQILCRSYNSRLRDLPETRCYSYCRFGNCASVPGAGRGAAREDSDRSPVRTGRCGHAVLYVMSPLGSVV